MDLHGESIGKIHGEQQTIYEQHLLKTINRPEQMGWTDGIFNFALKFITFLYLFRSFWGYDTWIFTERPPEYEDRFPKFSLWNQPFENGWEATAFFRTNPAVSSRMRKEKGDTWSNLFGEVYSSLFYSVWRTIFLFYLRPKKQQWTEGLDDPSLTGSQSVPFLLVLQG